MSGRVLALVLACMVLFGVVPVASHAPDLGPPEGVGNPSGLAGIEFIGPPYTEIESKPCDPIADADRGKFSDPTSGHIGHINGVMDGTGDFTKNWIQTNSIDLYHLELETYSNPRAIEGMHPVTDSTLSIMMGSDGYFRAQMLTPLPDGPGPDMVVQDVHDTRTYCIYGAKEKAGPYFFINSTYMDPTTSFQSAVDFADAYNALYTAEYPGEPVQAAWIFFISSVYVDNPVLIVDFGYEHSDDPYNLTYENIAFEEWAFGDGPGSTYEWSFGDGGKGTGPTPTYMYKRPGTYLVCLKVRAETGLVGEACKPVTVRNRPPVAGFSCFYATLDGFVTFQSQGKDPDGEIVLTTWDFGDGATGGTPTAGHMYPRSGTYNVTQVVRDDYGAQDTITQPCTTVIPNRPPMLEAIPLQLLKVGDSKTFTVVGRDPDLDPLTYSATLPSWATFDNQSLVVSITGESVGFYEDLGLRVEDPAGLSATGSFDVLVFNQVSDFDGDGIQDAADLCPGVPDPSQSDHDGDGKGDACDTIEQTQTPQGSAPGMNNVADIDDDGVQESLDNCRSRYNPRQEDMDRDAYGDACDTDIDGDGVPNWSALKHAHLDNCPHVSNPDQAIDPCSAKAADQADAQGGQGSADPLPQTCADCAIATEARAFPLGWVAGLAMAVLILVAAVGSVLWAARRP